MKKTILYLGLIFLFITTSAFEWHKFYVSITQVQYAPEKKRVQITCRIFIDDLNKALERKFHKKIAVETLSAASEEQTLLKKYITDHFKIRINGQGQTLTFHQNELENDVLVLYISIKNVSTIQQIEIQNSILMDWNSDQQNITHVLVNSSKKSLNFTDSAKAQMLKY